MLNVLCLKLERTLTCAHEGVKDELPGLVRVTPGQVVHEPRVLLPLHQGLPVLLAGTAFQANATSPQAGMLLAVLPEARGTKAMS